uniref:Xyloglucan galactosyltransferase KATAMARI1 isogeny n=1 Tax=Cajanus cajan TaxID=3821 RepID=A0A151S5X6_CAJCA|nr:Xyloglucan galactosyltransferase KATAMARI1 isogeny [Cajanus cajan]
MLTWQNSMRQRARPHLFSFVGGTRKGLEKAKVRDDIVRQCGDSKRCVLVRSTFDSVVAGCVPVFFSEHTAYTQYAWYLPVERGSYLRGMVDAVLIAYLPELC